MFFQLLAYLVLLHQTSVLFGSVTITYPTTTDNNVSITTTTTTSSGKGETKPRPEIEIRLGNGTILETQSGATVLLHQSDGQFQLFCSADYPIHWKHVVANAEIASLDRVEFHRKIDNISDYENSGGNSFLSTASLRGLLQSQTGRYVCSNFEPGFEAQSYFDIYIPGNNTFNAVPDRVYSLNDSDSSSSSTLGVKCPVTNPSIQVSLLVLNATHLNETGQEQWNPVANASSYNPTFGFHLNSTSSVELLGTYKCVADNGGDSLITKYVSSSGSKRDDETTSVVDCWEDINLVQYFRSQRLELYCGTGSYGKFVREDGSSVYMEALEKDSPELRKRFRECGDWRLKEFFNAGEESDRVCFRDRTSFPFETKLNATGTSYPHGDSERSTPFTKLTVTYNGLSSAASNVFLAIRRGEDNENIARLEFVDVEPSEKHFYPLAHHQVIWRDVIINGTDLQRVTVFQPHSDSFKIYNSGVAPELTVSRTFWQAVWDFFG